MREARHDSQPIAREENHFMTSILGHGWSSGYSGLCSLTVRGVARPKWPDGPARWGWRRWRYWRTGRWARDSWVGDTLRNCRVRMFTPSDSWRSPGAEAYSAAVEVVARAIGKSGEYGPRTLARVRQIAGIVVHVRAPPDILTTLSHPDPFPAHMFNTPLQKIWVVPHS